MAKLTDSDTITFGKYKGTKLANVPGSYLLWVDEQEWSSKFPDLKAYIKDNKDALVKEK